MATRVYLLQQCPRWGEIKHWASSLPWISYGGPVVVDGFRVLSTTSEVTVLDNGVERVLRASDFDKPTAVKLCTFDRGRRMAELLFLGESWGDQDVRGEIDTCEYLRRLAKRAASRTMAGTS